jgi:glucose-6-phosphate-specific signal transduction histidine kinase
MKRFLIFFLLAGAVPAFAQKDFLTSDEIEKVREAQEPNDRLKVYALLARQRLDQLQRLLEKEKKGRSLTARELLEDYSQIIDAIDTVSDDALKRGADIALGAAAVNDAEKRFLGQLQKIKDRAPADLDLYDVALKEALATTSDSMDLAREDSGTRAAKLAAEDKKTKEEAEQVIAAEDSKGKPVEEAKADGTKTEDGKPKRKPPTLLRKGEQAGAQK